MKSDPRAFWAIGLMAIATTCLFHWGVLPEINRISDERTSQELASAHYENIAYQNKQLCDSLVNAPTISLPHDPRVGIYSVQRQGKPLWMFLYESADGKTMIHVPIAGTPRVMQLVNGEWQDKSKPMPEPMPQDATYWSKGSLFVESTVNGKIQCCKLVNGHWEVQK